ncbi:hypothetical protein Dvina_32230 [Dactylosporangium vinaceum]|uniref:Uncharacterized protein n=1 Tax=Dactylosporangium vinaceum TaxID=53362 RepID=A0ABV5MAI6_9ACTN|nr:hypothetical protein [Dactylosporangium vinaceum]UAB92960.1 hypothetical protein Dvina_32230 [Dactylosporangium vinaceum]
MTEPSPARDVDRPGTPRWVKGFAIAGGVIVLLVVVALLAGHGPGRHLHHGTSPVRPAVSGSGW